MFGHESQGELLGLGLGDIRSADAVEKPGSPVLLTVPRVHGIEQLIRLMNDEIRPFRD